MEYLPFGEMLVEEHKNSNNSPYKFNGKELDEETGNYYYGARYYDPKWSIWLSVDPASEKFPSWSPYNYALDNPVKLVDPDGRSVEDIIEINKETGKISVTKASGDDVVRLVSNGNVESSYNYGSNGSFSSNNQIIKGSFDSEQGMALVTANGDKAQVFYEFAAESNVEFGKLDVKAPNGNSVSIITTSNDHKGVTTLPSIVNELSDRGYTGVKQSHSHPPNITKYNESVPSGYYDYKPNNPYSLMPYLQNGEKVGDAANAVQVRNLKGFENTTFEVYAPGNNTTTTYDGVHRAKIHKN